MRWLRWIAFGAAAALTASGEFELAQLAGWPWWVAWLLPVALDVYAFASFSTRRRMDTLAALALMIACNAAYHLAATGLVPAGWQLVVLVAALPPVICWRVHRLGEARAPEAAADDVPVPEAPAEPVAPVVPPARKLVAVPAERKQRQEVHATVRKRMPAAERRKQAEALQAAHPEWTRKRLAEELGICDRQLRNVCPAV